MKKHKKTSKLKKSIIRMKKISRDTKKIDGIQEIVGEVDSVKKVVSETFYIKDNIAIDLKNFSLLSIPSSKE